MKVYVKIIATYFDKRGERSMKRALKNTVLLLLMLLLSFYTLSFCSFAYYEIEENTFITVKMEKGETTFVTFIPKESGEYYFTSVSDCDTLGVLYDENMEELLFDDDGGETSNFYLRYNFTKGKKYIFGVYYYGKEIDYDMKLILRDVNFDLTHTHIFTQKVITEGSCDKPSLVELSCNCGFVKTEYTKTKDHSYTVVSQTLPSCTRSGVTVCVCTVCNEKIEIKAEKLGHDFSESLIVDKAPTCTAQGTASRHCSRCDKTADSVKLQRTQHILQKEYEVTKKPTCTAKGEKVKRCIVCKKIKEKEEIAKLGHSYETALKVDRKSTCEEKGEKSYHCKRCDSRKGVVSIPKIKNVSLNKNSFTYNGKTKKISATVKDSKGNELKKNKDYTLSYNKKAKSIGAYTVTVSFKGSYDGTVKCKYEIIPKNVSGLKISEKENSVTLSWEEVKGNVKYKVYRKSGKNGKKALVKTTDKTKVKIKDLKSGRDYTFSVTAVKEVKGKTHKSEKEATLKAATKPKAVKLKLESKKSRSITFTWKETSCDGYEIYKYNEEKEKYELIKRVKGGEVTKYERNNFAKGKAYTFKIRTYKKSGDKTLYSAFSKTVKIKVK